MPTRRLWGRRTKFQGLFFLARIGCLIHFEEASDLFGETFELPWYRLAESHDKEVEMRNLSVLVLICVLLVGFGVSCEKKTTATPTNAELTVPLTDIPASYGTL
jgi:hypothetical protein